MAAEAYAERAALAGLAFDRHPAAVSIDYLRNYSKAEADAALLAGDEGVEDGLDFIGGMPQPRSITLTFGLGIQARVTTVIGASGGRGLRGIRSAD